MTLGVLEQLAGGDRPTVPASVAWSLEEIGISRGRQELFAQQAPQVIKRLRDSAIVESAVSSNRIEGVDVEPARVATVVFGTRTLTDRDEEEVRGAGLRAVMPANTRNVIATSSNVTQVALHESGFAPCPRR